MLISLLAQCFVEDSRVIGHDEYFDRCEGNETVYNAKEGVVLFKLDYGSVLFNGETSYDRLIEIRSGEFRLEYDGSATYAGIFKLDKSCDVSYYTSERFDRYDLNKYLNAKICIYHVSHDSIIGIGDGFSNFAMTYSQNKTIFIRSTDRSTLNDISEERIQNHVILNQKAAYDNTMSVIIIVFDFLLIVALPIIYVKKIKD